MDRGLSTFLDAARWISALVVLVCHVAGLLFHETRGFAETSEPLELVAYCLINLGHYAVMVFFAISGYLVGGITLQRWMRSGPNLADYAVARVSRIYTVLLPALVIGMSLDLLGLRFFADSATYAGGLTHTALESVSTRISVETFVLNLALLQGMYVDQLGSNVPVWSLAYEWWYYCLFASVAGAALLKGWIRYAMMAVSIVLAYAMPIHMLIWGSIWLMGLVTYFVIPKLRSVPHPLIGLAVLLGSLLVACYTANPDYRTAPEPIWMSIARDGSIGLAFCFAMACFRGAKVRGERFHSWAAQFSYTTYLVHFPALLLLFTALNQIGWVPLESAPTWGGFAWLVPITAVLYGWCYLAYWLTERHTNRVRAALKDATLAVLKFARA